MAVEETVLGVITNANLHAGFLGAKTRSQSLVITDSRVLFARQTVSKLKKLTHEANPGKGLLSASGAQTYALLIEQYMAMSPDDILAEHADNFAINRSTISKVKIKTSSGGESGVATDTLIIKTSEKTYKLTLVSAAQARAVLKEFGLLAR